MLLVEVWRSKIGFIFFGKPENSRLYILFIFVQNACGQLKYKQTLKQANKMHAAMQRATEQDSSMEVKNAVNSQLIIWFMQGIYYE